MVITVQTRSHMAAFDLLKPPTRDKHLRSLSPSHALSVPASFLHAHRLGTMALRQAMRRAIAVRSPFWNPCRTSASSALPSSPCAASPSPCASMACCSSSSSCCSAAAESSPFSPQFPTSSFNLNPANNLNLNPSSNLALSWPSPAAIAADRAVSEGPRHDWQREEIQAIYDSPLLDLLFHGAQVHRHAHKFREVQQCTLLSIKTGGCSEDCAYCPQSSRYKTEVKAQKLLSPEVVLEAAKKAKEAGSTRFCMGTAWRDTLGRKTNFNQILQYVKEIRGMGMEVCCTLGMLEKQQAEALKEAGLTAYNHNLDTSREFYPKIITTRSYDERLQTLQFVRESGISVCSGGIIGLGEAAEDRVGLLHTLATLPEHPESVPINALIAVQGTPLQDQKPVEVWEMIRMIGTARIVMPKAMVRLSAGRVRFSVPEQALCFMAGANSIFTGEKLLTTPNNDFDADQEMFKILGLVPKAPNFEQGHDVSSKSSQHQDAEPAAAAAQ